MQKPHLLVWAGKLLKLMGGSIEPRTETWVNLGIPIAMVPCMHQGNFYIKRKLWVWKAQKCISLVGGESQLTSAGGKLPRLMVGGIRPRTETCVSWGGPIAMVPCLQQGNVYIKRKLRVWRAQKCIPLVGAKTPLTCASRQNTPSHEGRYRAEYRNLRKSGWTYRYGTVFCTKAIFYITRKLQVWRVQKCNPLVGAGNPLSCAGWQTTQTHGGQYRAENGNLRKLVWTYHHGTMFAPQKYIYPKRHMGMERTEMYSLSRWRKPTYLCGPANYPVSWGGRMGPRTETCVNWSGPIAIVPCLHQGNV